MLKNASVRTEVLGIEILDFQFKRTNYADVDRPKVYERMISERKRIAEEYRSEGAGEAARISGSKDRDLKEITSEAYREAQEIRGKADAEAADIYARAYNKDPEFYRFLKTMEVYRTTLDSGDDSDALDPGRVSQVPREGEVARAESTVHSRQSSRGREFK